MKYARIENNIVQEIIDFNPQGRYTQKIVQQFIECPESTKQNMIYENGEFKENVVVIDPIDTIMNELAELDKVITRQVEQMYEDAGITPSYQPMVDAMTRKQELRLLLRDYL